VTGGGTRRDATADCDNTTGGTADVTDGCCRAMSCTAAEPGCDALPTTLITPLVVTGTAETGYNNNQEYTQYKDPQHNDCTSINQSINQTELS